MKKISLLILMLTFLLIPTCVNANSVSYDDFALEVEKATGLNFTEILNSNNLYTQFINDFNNCTSFGLFGDFGFASTSPTVVNAENMWVVFNTNGTNTVNFTSTSAGQVAYTLSTSNGYATKYQLVVDTEKLTRTTYTQSSLFSYYLDQQINWSQTNFLSETGMTHFLDTAYSLSWNLTANCNYYDLVDGSYVRVNKLVELDSLSDSNFPWEEGNSGGNTSGDTYYNYDFGEYFQKPWIAIDNVQGLVQNTATIPFKVMSQSGDEYYPFDKLKLDLRVYKVFTDENGNKTQSLFDTYKRYNGDYVDTAGYGSVSQNGKINVYNYDLRNKFDSNFIDTYLNTSGDNFDYAFQLILYSFWEDELSSTKLFYFNENNNLNFGTIPDDYYNDWNSGGNFNFENMNFDSILNTAKNFLSSIFSVFEIFPDWLIYLLAFGVAVGIFLRILGR